MKALKYILYGLVIAAAAGLMGYQILVEKNVDSNNITRCILIIGAAILGMLRPNRSASVRNKKTTYQKAYAEHIRNAFEDNSKLEAKFYNAIHDYNRGKPAAAIAKLDKLRKECQRTADLRAVEIFTALCYDDMGLHDQSIPHYQAALSIQPNSSLCSNMGLAYSRLGDETAAEKAYADAIRLDPGNAFAHNNLATLWFRRGNYTQALKCAEDAIAIHSAMPQALSTAAICCALLEDPTGYETYYRQAVASGYDGQKIKNFLNSINPHT